MTTETLTVEIPADVRDNSHKVTDYAFMRHTSAFLKPPTPGERDRDILYADVFGYTHYQWHDTAPGGQRCRFDVMVNRAGEFAHFFHTEYFTRVKCSDCEHHYAVRYIQVTGPGDVTSGAHPYCDYHADMVRKWNRNLPGYTVAESEPLLIGQHD